LTKEEEEEEKGEEISSSSTLNVYRNDTLANEYEKFIETHTTVK
jgi:hypothetical protein